MFFFPPRALGYCLSFILAFWFIEPGVASPNAEAPTPISPEIRQLLISIAPGWDSSSGRMIGLERGEGGAWKPALGPISVLFGSHGLAWGRGVLGSQEAGRHKQEHDGRAPAGVFEVGKIYTYDPALPPGADYPFHTVTEGDAWVDDPSLPEYNRYVAVDPKNPPPWFEKEKMRSNDFAYRWLVEVRHNADPPVPGMGSAIFFHIRRGETRPTSGCTTMARENLVSMIRWLRAAGHPHYVLLPWSEYRSKWKAWGLPNPALLGSIAPQ
jgi:L,D-peptidoglycan transpeptidase YkuD (ErfK/YbiS/YcfS/YnhG family)